jgi:hypothetical protein
MRIEDRIQLKVGEEMLEMVHEDLWPRTPGFLLHVFCFVVPFFFLFPLFREGLIGVVVFFALCGTALFFGYRAYKRWSGTVLVLTDRRVVDVDQRGLFDCVVSETPYTRIDDVTYHVKGFWPTLLRYGDIRIHVAGTAADIAAARVPHPARVHDLINDLRQVVRDDEKTRRERKLQEIARSLSVEEIDRMAQTIRRTQRDQAVHELYRDGSQQE